MDSTLLDELLEDGLVVLLVELVDVARKHKQRQSELVGNHRIRVAWVAVIIANERLRPDVDDVVCKRQISLVI